MHQKWIFNALAHYAENTAAFDSRTKLLEQNVDSIQGCANPHPLAAIWFRLDDSY